MLPETTTRVGAPECARCAELDADADKARHAMDGMVTYVDRSALLDVKIKRQLHEPVCPLRKVGAQ